MQTETQKLDRLAQRFNQARSEAIRKLRNRGEFVRGETSYEIVNHRGEVIATCENGMALIQYADRACMPRR